MKNGKRVAAIAGVILLLVAFALPMIFAFGQGETTKELFRAALGVAFLVPVLAYLFLMSYRVFGRKQTKEPNGKIKNVIFDVGNVLVDFGWQGYLESFGFPKETYEKIADAVFRSKVWEERDQGLLEEEEYVRRFISGAPEYETEIREVMRRCAECVHVRDYAPVWLKYLREKGYGIYILSNYSHYMLKRNKPQMTFLKYADGEIFSCNVRQIKPHADIYETLMNRYGLKAQESVFLDDNQANCEAAEKLGIHAIHFEDFQQAAEALKKMGVE